MDVYYFLPFLFVLYKDRIEGDEFKKENYREVEPERLILHKFCFNAGK